MSRAVYAVMGTVLFGALVIMVAGFEALLLDRDPIDEPDAGTLLGPLMVAAAVLVVLLSLLRSAALSDARDDRAPEVRGTFLAQPAVFARPAGSGATRSGTGDEVAGPRGPAPHLLVVAIVTAALVYVLMLAVGGVVYGLVRQEVVWVLLFAARYAVSPFVIGSAVCAGLVVGGTLAVSRVDPGRSDPRPFD
ncbi:DUF6121 family protein [Frigoribacterium sp. VKM Ac-2836]|uniref:DUF6121 family protein n=1 Tax=Frigoribacterium sp. VKM Ac-2836 TaxID=2739014 RepID=UPI001564ED5B|nr:DUF6121 family protein [Frigoribacterium sp. VKM Ac-2836]NRD26673.1 hypothetical protein [Frigoribacterium sp. VKM Ac-2836]